MAKSREIARLTVGDVMLPDVFAAIERGLPLWLAEEAKRTGRADPKAALCAGSYQALERALAVLCLFASQRASVAVRVTLSMLEDVPHGGLTASQVFYRWNARLGAQGNSQLRGAPTINGRTFAVRPIVENVKRGERIVRVEVAVQRRKGATPEVVPYEAERIVDITHALPHDPTDLRIAANRVVRLTRDVQPSLSRILTTLFEEFGIVIRNILGWVQRRRTVRKDHTLLLAREAGVEVVLIADGTGGGVALASPTGDEPRVEIEERTEADAARAALDDLFRTPMEMQATHEQNIFDLLDSMPTEEESEALRVECVRIRGETDRTIEDAVAELVGVDIVDETWLERARDAASTATREALLGRHSQEIALDLARRHVHGGLKTKAIAGRRALRGAGTEEPSAAHRAVIKATRRIVESLPRFYGAPILHAILNERLAVLQAVLELYSSRNEHSS